jgi:ribosomal protein L37AE/L43A
MSRLPVVYHVKPWPHGCPKCRRRCLAKKQRFGGWRCVQCGHQQQEEPT